LPLPWLALLLAGLLAAFLPRFNIFHHTLLPKEQSPSMVLSGLLSSINFGQTEAIADPGFL